MDEFKAICMVIVFFGVLCTVGLFVIWCLLKVLKDFAITIIWVVAAIFAIFALYVAYNWCDDKITAFKNWHPFENNQVIKPIQEKSADLYDQLLQAADNIQLHEAKSLETPSGNEGIKPVEEKNEKENEVKDGKPVIFPKASIDKSLPFEHVEQISIKKQYFTLYRKSPVYIVQFQNRHNVSEMLSLIDNQLNLKGKYTVLKAVDNNVSNSYVQIASDFVVLD